MPLSYEFLNPEKILQSQDFSSVSDFLKITKRTNIGWHYIIDLIWIYSHAVKWPQGCRVLDAGGGRGPVQFLLAEMGFDVTNIDLFHTQPDFAFFSRYGTKRNALNSYVETRYVEHIKGFGRYRQQLKRVLKTIMESSILRESTTEAYAKKHEKWRTLNGFNERKVGSIQWFTGNLCNVPEIETGSFDVVVSLSALEHIPLEILPTALAEIRRLIRPDGHWAVTTSGTELNATWYHQPAQGYCFSKSDLESIYQASAKNTEKPVDIMRLYQTSHYLKENLALNYRLSGNNGMPWGKWRPLYIPVGIADDSSHS